MGVEYNYSSYEVLERATDSFLITKIMDVCNIDRIYNKGEGFEYSLPRNVLEGFLSGQAFDHKEAYSEEEGSQLREDIRDLYDRILESQPCKERMAIITAGAPGAGKTKQLHKDLETQKLLRKNYAYIDPDDVCLQNQMRTYKRDIAKDPDSLDVRIQAYNKWRPGSNAMAHLILAHLIRDKYAFYFGSTSSGSATGKFFEFIHKQGYKIRLIHVTAPDDIRWGSIQKRDKTFVQTTEKDVREKGFLLPQRINDTFLAYADIIEFFYRDEVEGNARLAARWIRHTEKSAFLGTLEILRGIDYERIKDLHNKIAAFLQRPDLYWETSVEKTSNIFVQSDLGSE